MIVRLATVEDAANLAVLNQDVQRLHADAQPHRFRQPNDVAAVECDFRERLLVDPNGRVFIAEVGDQPVGYIVTQIVQRAENPYTFAFRFVHIDQISVKPAFRRLGCGRALVQAVFDLARAENIERVTLDTWAFNTEAHQFFARMGFSVFIYRMDTMLSTEQ